MAENETKPTKVSVSAFIDALMDETRRTDAKALVKLMQSATGEKPKMWGPRNRRFPGPIIHHALGAYGRVAEYTIIGFGSYHYAYESGREGDMPLAGFSPRKAATVVYGMMGFSDEVLRAKLGKHTTGGGCLYIKKLADVDQKVLEALILRSVAAKRAEHPK